MEGFLPQCKHVWMHLSWVMPMGEIAENLDLPWNIYVLIDRPGITMNILMNWWEAGGRTIPWHYVSRHMPMDQVRRYPGMPWNREGLSSNPDITLDVVRMDLPRATGRWSVNDLSRLLPLDDALTIPEIRRDPRILSKNVHLTIYDARRLGILDGRVTPRMWQNISSVVPISNVLTHPHLPWNRWGLSSNPGITLEVVRMNMPKATDMWTLHDLLNNLPISDIREMISGDDMPISTTSLSCRKDLPMDIIHLLGADEVWLWSCISKYASTDDILNNPGFPWDKKLILLYNREVDMARLVPTGRWPRAAELAAMPIEEARRMVTIGRNIAYNPALTMNDVRYIVYPDCHTVSELPVSHRP